MKMVALVFGAGGALWRDKLRGALDRLRGRLAREDVDLAIWGVELASAIDRTSTVISRWFSADAQAEMKQLSEHLAGGEVKLAVIASPNETHVGILCFLLDKVPYIVVEKPLSDDPMSARFAVSQSEAATVSVCKGIDHYIAKPAVRKALTWSRGNELTERIGELIEVRFAMMEARAIDPARASTLNKGLTFDLAIHGFALLAKLLEISDLERFEVDHVAAAKYHGAPIDGETAARIELCITNGPRATLDIGKGLIDDKRLTLVGTERTMDVDIDKGVIALGRNGEKGKIVYRAERDDSYDMLLEEAIRGTLKNATPPHPTNWLIDIRSAANALELVARARSQFAEIGAYACGTLPRIFAERALLNGAHVETYANRESLERAVLREMLASSREAIDRLGRFVLVIPGGSSFLGVGRLLADRLTSVDLSRWEIFFSDEHGGLPHDSGENNYALAFDDGGWGALVDARRLRSKQLHRVVTEEAGRVLDAEALSSHLSEYERAYRSALGQQPGADLAILGLGSDCHTASILPTKGGFVSSLLGSTRQFDVVVYPESYDQPSRLRASITLRGICAAHHVLLLSFGKAKSQALRDVLTGPIDVAARPGSLIRRVHGTVITDRDGAVLLHAP